MLYTIKKKCLLFGRKHAVIKLNLNDDGDVQETNNELERNTMAPS